MTLKERKKKTKANKQTMLKMNDHTVYGKYCTSNLGQHYLIIYSKVEVIGPSEFKCFPAKTV